MKINSDAIIVATFLLCITLLIILFCGDPDLMDTLIQKLNK